MKYQSGYMKYVVVALVVVLSFMVFLVVKNKKETVPIERDTSIVLESHYKGAEQPVILIEEYGDFQCPACAAYVELVKTVVDEFGDSVRVQYKHFPLTQIHPHAFTAAQVAEAAGIQGKFWEMHDVLFENQEEWSRMTRTGAKKKFLEYAESLGLDTTQLERQMLDPQIREKIFSDQASGTKIRVGGTPSFTMNGDLVETPRNIDEFRALITTRLGVKESEE
jgi:protein-disulfide isomerase